MQILWLQIYDLLPQWNKEIGRGLMASLVSLVSLRKLGKIPISPYPPALDTQKNNPTRK